jgi:hypothetical protein
LAVCLIPFIRVMGADLPQEFRITDVEGQVAVIPNGTTRASPAVKDFLVQPGDRIITGETGRVEVAAKEGTVIELREKSVFRITGLSGNKSSFFLKVGRMLGQFAPSSTTRYSYQVRTPVAVAAVRGTDLALVMQEDGEMQGGVIEGQVDFGARKTGPNAPIDWSDDVPAAELDADDIAEPLTEPAEARISEEPIAVETAQGIVVKPDGMPEKLFTIPPLVVPSVERFTHIRARVRPLRDQWQNRSIREQMEHRRQALRQEIDWEPPARHFDRISKPAPAKQSPPKRQ